MVDITQATPFVGVVASARQKKLPQGTEVEVRVIKEGQYGYYAMAFVEDTDKPVFLKPTHIDYVSDVTAERQAEIDAEKAAWLAEKNTPVAVGRGEPHPGGKSFAADVFISLEATDQAATRRAFFPLSMLTEVDGGYAVAPWLAKIKAADAAYYWLSNGGRSGIDHLGGAGISAQFGSGLTYSISLGDLIEAAGR